MEFLSGLKTVKRLYSFFTVETNQAQKTFWKGCRTEATSKNGFGQALITQKAITV
jgi:hypothetical protein